MSSDNIMLINQSDEPQQRAHLNQTEFITVEDFSQQAARNLEYTWPFNNIPESVFSRALPHALFSSFLLSMKYRLNNV
jgi:hypothetical protein